MGALMADSANVRFSGADNYLRAAMTGLAARQRAIANNIANIDTPNFKASEVRFEDTLKTALSRGRSGGTPDQSALNQSFRRTTLVDGTSTRGDGNNVDVDREMEKLAETNLTFSALTQVMSSRLGILRGVVSGR
jgi:flagellar basal-body rod protein FlgB